MPYQDLEIEKIKVEKEIIMKSSDGTEWKIIVNNVGSLIITKV